ncbi:MAG: acyl-CoA thioesterase [Cyclobacteriaceae bacterium]
MDRVKLVFPEKVQFETRISVRITDLNYGAHLGNNSLLGIVHEARVQFLQSIGCKGEVDLGEGAGIIMRDVAIVFKAEIFYPESLIVQATAANIEDRSFDLYYRILLEKDMREAALVKTGIVCFDYQARKPATLPSSIKTKLMG